MAEKNYKGGCHCGRVRYEVSLELGEVMSCNCSICSKKGWLLTFTGAEKFRLTAGDEAVSDYLFHKKAIHHYFCKTCGISSFCRATWNGNDTVAINARCLEGVDIKNLKIKEVDGASA